MVTEAIIVVGGKGTRLKEIVKDRPKPMANVAGRPFLEWLLLALRAQGIRRVVLGAGYKGDMVSEYFGDGAGWGLDIAYSRETAPLGTGGAARLALKFTRTDPLLVLNGDSYCAVDLERFAAIHARRKASVSLWLVQVKDCSRYGTVTLSRQGRIAAFQEKSLRGKSGLISAGVYLFNRKAVSEIPGGRPVSLEEEVFPGLVGKALYGVVGRGPFLDIGTPDSYAAAAAVLSGELKRLEKSGPPRTEEKSCRSALRP